MDVYQQQSRNCVPFIRARLDRAGALPLSIQIQSGLNLEVSVLDLVMAHSASLQKLVLHLTFQTLRTLSQAPPGSLPLLKEVCIGVVDGRHGNEDVNVTAFSSAPRLHAVSYTDGTQTNAPHSFWPADLT